MSSRPPSGFCHPVRRQNPRAMAARVGTMQKGSLMAARPGPALESCGGQAGRPACYRTGRPQPCAQRRMAVLHDRPRRQTGVATALPAPQDTGPAMGADEPVTPPRPFRTGGAGRVVREKSPELRKRSRKRESPAFQHVHPRVAPCIWWVRETTGQARSEPLLCILPTETPISHSGQSPRLKLKASGATCRSSEHYAPVSAVPAGMGSGQPGPMSSIQVGSIKAAIPDFRLVRRTRQRCESRAYPPTLPASRTSSCRVRLRTRDGQPRVQSGNGSSSPT